MSDNTNDDDETRGLSRRGVLRAAGAGALLIGAGAAVPSAAAPPQRKRGTGMSTDPVLHALRRLTFGATTVTLERARRIGVDAWLDEQLRPELIPDVEVERILALFPTLRMSSAEIREAYSDKRSRIVGELSVASVVRACWSERQLHELMVDFWTQHLNINMGHDPAYGLKTVDDREVIRPHALGRFADLLAASARSPAMLAYLDNWVSSKRRPNENYARELLELHTVGVQGGYTERDVKNAAKVLTGWTFGSDLTFLYRPERHALGPVRVMGWSHPNAHAAKGVEVGLSMLDYLAHHPSTATNIARKLCVRLVSDNPSPTLVRSTAQVYLKNDTQIAPVIRHIVASREWRTSIGRKLRRPLELLAASVRALELRYDLARDSPAGAGLLHLLHPLEHVPFGWRTPDGYPDHQDAWLSTLAMLQRWNMQQKLANGGVPGLTGPSASRLLPTGHAPTTAGQLVDMLGQRLLFQGVPPTDRATVLAGMGWSSSTPLTGGQAEQAAPKVSAYLLSTAVHQLR